MFTNDFQNGLVPMVVEQTERGERSFDIFSMLLNSSRIIFLNGQVDSSMAALVTSQLLYLQSKGSEKIYLYVNSPGGSVYDGLAITNCIAWLQNANEGNPVNVTGDDGIDVVTINLSMAASMGSFICAAGSRGHRYALESSRTMIHSVSSGAGRASVHDLRVSMAETEFLNTYLTKKYSEYTGHPVEEFEKRMERDCFLSGEQAKELGLCDKVVRTRRDMHDISK